MRNSDRTRVSVLLLTAFSTLILGGCMRIVAMGLGVEPGDEKVKVEKNVMVPMRDGVRLATDVYSPKAPGKYPAIMTRLPYGSDVTMFEAVGKFFAKSGYVFLVQDTRGTFDSEGEWFPMIFEYDDGHDAIEWVTGQPWYDGNLGMLGGSYFGYTQWVAAPDNPAVTCMNPLFTSGSIHKIIFRGGAQEHISIVPWNAQMLAARLEKEGQKNVELEIDLTQGWYNEPVRDAVPVDVDAELEKPDVYEKGMQEWLRHPGDIENVSQLNFEQYYSRVSSPSLLVAGWYDVFLGPQVYDFVRIRKEGLGDAKKTRIIIGPWTHGIPSSKMEQKRVKGLLGFGRETIEWFDYWLKGIDNGAGEAAPVRIFVMGENVWRDEHEWPLERTIYTNYYLHSKGGANSIDGDGWLSTEPPGNESPDEFTYDPRDPVPTAGGYFLGATREYRPGPADQSKIERRDDLLMYVTPPLQEPVEVTGPIRLILYAASSALDTDFTAKLVDICPRGSSKNLQESIIRARYRDGYQHPTQIRPGKAYQYEIDLWATSNVFMEGHRIGLEVSSSNFPHYDRNTNAGGEGGPDNIIEAEQTVYHDKVYPSHIILPVIPR